MKSLIFQIKQRWGRSAGLFDSIRLARQTDYSIEGNDSASQKRSPISLPPRSDFAIPFSVSRFPSHALRSSCLQLLLQPQVDQALRLKPFLLCDRSHPCQHVGIDCNQITAPRLRIELKLSRFSLIPVVGQAVRVLKLGNRIQAISWWSWLIGVHRFQIDQASQFSTDSPMIRPKCFVFCVTTVYPPASAMPAIRISASGIRSPRRFRSA